MLLKYITTLVLLLPPPYKQVQLSQQAQAKLKKQQQKIIKPYAAFWVRASGVIFRQLLILYKVVVWRDIWRITCKRIWKLKWTIVFW